MWQKHSGQTASEETQNLFTAYLLTAVKRTRAAHFRKLYFRQDHEVPVEDLWYPITDTELNEMDSFPLLQRLDNPLLWCALNQLSDRELYVLLERAVEEKSFDELASELNLKYKGVAAIYYRTIEKVKSAMKEGKRNEL